MTSLVADYGSSDSDSSNSNSDLEDEIEIDKREDSSQPKLPLPRFGAENLSVKNSVFANPFIEAENAKESILEKHVKMIPAKDDLTNINGKKICWMYRKGRCRFGHNCKFAHDSDIHSNDATNADVNPDDSLTSLTSESNPSSAKASNGITSKVDIGVKKKKRPGLSQAVVPGKKVLKLYKKQKLADSSNITNISSN